MLVDGHRLVRPGFEPKVRALQQRRRLIEIVGTVFIAGIGLTISILFFVWILPNVPESENWFPTWLRLLLLILSSGGLALLTVFLGWFVSLALAEKIYLAQIGQLTREAWSLRDWFGVIPDLPASELWAALDRYEIEGTNAFHHLAPER